jgi:hypothetical protein
VVPPLPQFRGMCPILHRPPHGTLCNGNVLAGLPFHCRRNLSFSPQYIGTVLDAQEDDHLGVMVDFPLCVLDQIIRRMVPGLTSTVLELITCASSHRRFHGNGWKSNQVADEVELYRLEREMLAKHLLKF